MTARRKAAPPPAITITLDYDADGARATVQPDDGLGSSYHGLTLADAAELAAEAVHTLEVRALRQQRRGGRR